MIKGRRMLRVAVLGLMLSTVCASAAEPWEGLWAAEASWCRNSPGETDQVPVRYSRTGIEGLESACSLTKVTRLQKVNAWILDQSCSGEGESWSARELVMVTDEGDMVRFTEEGFAITMKRCRQ
jgi:hypothetical protein